MTVIGNNLVNDRKTNGPFSKEDKLVNNRKTNYLLSKEDNVYNSKEAQQIDRKTISSYSKEDTPNNSEEDRIINDRKTNNRYSKEDSLYNSKEDQYIDDGIKCISVTVDHRKEAKTQPKSKLKPTTSIMKLEDDRKTDVQLREEESNSEEDKCTKKKIEYNDRKTLDYFVQNKGKTTTSKEDKTENIMQQHPAKLKQHTKLKTINSKNRPTKDRSLTPNPILRFINQFNNTQPHNQHPPKPPPTANKPTTPTNPQPEQNCIQKTTTVINNTQHPVTLTTDTTKATPPTPNNPTYDTHTPTNPPTLPNLNPKPTNHNHPVTTKPPPDPTPIKQHHQHPLPRTEVEGKEEGENLV